MVAKSFRNLYGLHMITHAPIAVLTGDLVNSGALGPEKIVRAFRALTTSAEQQAGWMGAPLRFTRHRGDGWQAVLMSPQKALRSALTFRAALRAEGDEFDSYIAIAEGPAPERFLVDLNAHTEDVFVRSGHGLDDLKKTQSALRMTHQDSGPVAAAVILGDYLSQGWTQAQAQAILQMLDPTFSGTQSDIARRLGKSRQAVAKALQAAGWETLDYALATLERGLADD